MSEYLLTHMLAIIRLNQQRVPMMNQPLSLQINVTNYGTGGIAYGNTKEYL